MTPRDDDTVLLADLYSHRSLNEYLAYDEAMCQCPDVCQCPGMEDNDEKETTMKSLGSEPIRVLLIPIVLGALVAAAQAFIAGADTRAIITAAIGALILAAQELGRSLVTPVAKPSGEDGYGLVEVLLVVFLVLVILLVVLRLA